MYRENCNLITQENQFFDITHTFKIGSTTYHVLGLRHDRPTYKNTYYIFNCTDDQHVLISRPWMKGSSARRSATPSEHIHKPKIHSHTPHQISMVSMNDATTNQVQNKNSTVSHVRARTESPKRMNINTTTFKGTLHKVMRVERQMLVASLRKEMNIKNRTLIRTIKKEKEVLLQTTTDANNKQEIIRLLEEQKNCLEMAFEKYVNTTTSSIDILKQILLETLDGHYVSSQSIEQRQLNLIQTIEQEIKKLILKNEEILKSTSSETNAINNLQTVLIEKIENLSTIAKHNDDTTLKSLFTEQKQALIDAVAQQQEQQQTTSLDLIKQTMIDTIKEQKTLPFNINTNVQNIEKSIDNTITNTLGLQTSIRASSIVDYNSLSLPRTKSIQQSNTHKLSSSKSSTQKYFDQNLFKISIRTPDVGHLFAKLIVGDKEYPRRSHTLCQRDASDNGLFNCYIAPPDTDGPYEITLYVKTSNETNYRAAICIRLPGSNHSQAVTFPILHQAFEQYQCILIGPLRRILHKNEQVLIHMIVPGAHTIKIRNGDDNIELNINEYKNEIVKKKLRVRGDVYVIGCWKQTIDSIICVFNMSP